MIIQLIVAILVFVAFLGTPNLAASIEYDDFGAKFRGEPYETIMVEDSITIELTR